MLAEGNDAHFVIRHSYLLVVGSSSSSGFFATPVVYFALPIEPVKQEGGG